MTQLDPHAPVTTASTVLKNDKLAGKTSTREPLTTPLTADETQGTLPPSAGQILEEGLDHLQEQTVQQSIEKQSARVYKHPESFSTFVAPFRLPVQRADQRTRWERFVDKWFGPAPLGKEQRERFEIRLDDPIVARALAGKLSKLDTQHVLDRVRYMTIYGNRTERLNALQIVNQAAASFMEGRKSRGFFSTETSAASRISWYYSNLARAYARDREHLLQFALKEHAGQFSTRLKQQTNLADRLVMYLSSKTGKKLLTRADIIESAYFNQKKYESYLQHDYKLREETIHRQTKEITTRIDEQIKQTVRRVNADKNERELLNEAGRLSLPSFTALHEKFKPLPDHGDPTAMEDCLFDKATAPEVGRECEDRLAVTLEVLWSANVSAPDGVTFDQLIPQPALAGALLPIVRALEAIVPGEDNGDQQQAWLTFKHIEDGISQRFGEGGVKYLRDAFDMARRWLKKRHTTGQTPSTGQ